MNDLGLDLEQIRTWFPHEQDGPYILIRVDVEHAQSWAQAIGLAVRRCYVTDTILEHSAVVSGVPQLEIIGAKLPDAGAVMAGDFGEILVYLYQGAREHPAVALGATKWRLKQDRRMPAPHSDVIHLVLPAWPAASEQDTVICSEVKTKSTNGTSTPIASAIADCAKDRTSRLARTLSWLRERAFTEDLGDLQLAHLQRFVNAAEHPEAQKRFGAVAVVCAGLLDVELGDAPTAAHPDYTVAVIAVPDLQAIYTSVFVAAQQAVVAPGPVPAPQKLP